MKTIKWFILATSIVALLSCSTNYAPSLDDEPTFDGDTRSDTTATKTDTTGVSGIITDWDDGGKADITMDEVPFE